MNMSTRPATEATWRIDRTGAVPVRFRLEGEARRRAGKWDPDVLDRTWDFTGAALVSNYRVDVHGDVFRPADEMLVANVLGRIRANLLLARAPIVLGDGFLERDVVCDDRRVACLAGAIG